VSAECVEHGFEASYQESSFQELRGHARALDGKGLELSAMEKAVKEMNGNVEIVNEKRWRNARPYLPPPTLREHSSSKISSIPSLPSYGVPVEVRLISVPYKEDILALGASAASVFLAR